MKLSIVFILIFSFSVHAQQKRSNLSQQDGPGVSGGGSFIESEVYGLAKSIAVQLLDAEDVLNDAGLDARRLSDKLQHLKFQEWKVQGLNIDERAKPYRILNENTVEINAPAWLGSMLKSRARYMLQIALEVAKIPISYKNLMATIGLAIPSFDTVGENSVVNFSKIIESNNYQSSFILNVNDKSAKVTVEYWTAYRDVIRYECQVPYFVESEPVFLVQAEVSPQQQLVELKVRCQYKGYEFKENKVLLQDYSLRGEDYMVKSGFDIVSSSKLDLKAFDSHYRIEKKANNQVEVIHEEELGYALRRIRIVTKE